MPAGRPQRHKVPVHAEVKPWVLEYIRSEAKARRISQGDFLDIVMQHYITWRKTTEGETG